MTHRTSPPISIHPIPSHPPSSLKPSFMDNTKSPTPNPSSLSNQDFDPEFEWSTEEGSYTLRIHLPGFKNENLRVEVDDYGNLMTSGERQLDSTQRIRFSKVFRIPEDCNVEDVYAKFEKEVLYVIQPKVKTTGLADHPQDRLLPVAQTAPTEPQTKPKPQPAAEQQHDKNRKAGERVSGETAMKQEEGKNSELVDTAAVRFDYGAPSVRPTKPIQPLLNVAVALLVLVCLAMYVAYKLGKATG